MLEFLRRIFSTADFVVRVLDGAPEVCRGKVASGFLRDCREICRREKIVSGTIYGVRQGDGHISLSFSGNIPEGCRQMLLNAWNLHV
ncbi:MAG: DUF3634 family protein [Victivallales bacterium]|nr:DUF3634 family protein [Victivallales bacterium]